jgi:ketosteroid isomerase-like protein
MTDSADQLVDRYHAAMVAADADAFAGLYAPDGIHEFPFFNPYGVTRLDGPDQIRSFYQPLWSASDVVLDRVDSTALHHTDDRDTVIDELVSTGRRGPSRRPFRLAGLVVLTARDGRIVKVRDYLDLLGLSASEDTSKDS